LTTVRPPLSDLGIAFARSLIGDLACLGHQIEIVDGVPRYCFGSVQGTHRSFYRDAHLRLHEAQLRGRLDRILELEADIGGAFAEGGNLDFEAVTPRLRPVDMRRESGAVRRDRAVVQYLRSYQTVGSKMSVGRENAFILEDVGQTEKRLMGVLVLASPRYFQPRRDEVLGWPTPSRLRPLTDAEQAHWRAVRESGLIRMMHVAVCCALPPYSQLGAAKLLAVAPFTGEVRRVFETRWRHKDPDPDLALLTTTSSMGRTGTPFQDLRTALYFDPAKSAPRGEKWNRHARLYARLADTHPWQPGVPIASPELFANFESLVTDKTRRIADSFLAERSLQAKSPDQALAHAMRLVGLGAHIFRGNPVGVFLGAIDRESIEAVATGRPRVVRSVASWEMAIGKFRRDFGAEPDPERKTGADWQARAEAVAARRARAQQVQTTDILLSQRLIRHRMQDDADGKEAD
jgi:hypothetical protein